MKICRISFPTFGELWARGELPEDWAWSDQWDWRPDTLVRCEQCGRRYKFGDVLLASDGELKCAHLLTDACDADSGYIWKVVDPPSQEAST